MAKEEGKKRTIPCILACIVIAIIACVALAGIAGAGYWLFQSGEFEFLSDYFSEVDFPSIPENITISSNFNMSPEKPLSAGEEIVIGKNDERLAIPETALDSDVNAVLHTSAPDAKLEKILQEVFKSEANLYQVLADGENDGTGPAIITAPVNGKQAYLLEIIDGEYYSLTNLEPDGGELSFQVPIASASKDEGDDSLKFDGSYQFALIQSIEKITLNTPGSHHLAKSTLQPDPRSCGFESFTSMKGELPLNFCRQNVEGTIKVNVPSAYGKKANIEKVDHVVDVIEKIMNVYENKGFAAAQLKKAGNRVHVVVKSGSGDPYYSPSNGTVYIPDDSVASGGTGLEWELAHELAHWVQDYNYNFTSAYWANLTGSSSYRTWWLEVSAENMVFLFDPAAIEHNLTYYGMTTVATHNTPFQYSPNLWNDQLYNHAQLVKVFMCENSAVCPISESGFVEAINTGAFPYNGENAVNQVSENLEEYARYLLGESPRNANSHITIMPAVKTGSGYGEYIGSTIKQGISELKITGYEPQMVISGEQGSQIINVKAEIQHGGVYPLVVNVGSNTNLERMPLQVRVSASAPFYYRIGDGDIQYNDGSKDMVLGVVHAVWGAEKIRIVAVAPDEDVTFNAEIRDVDFSGVWTLNRGEKLSVSNITCGRELKKWEAELSVNFSLPLVLQMGDFTTGNSSSELNWVANQERWEAYSAGKDPSLSTLDVMPSKASALITPSEVLMSLEYQEKESPPYEYDDDLDAVIWDQVVGSHTYDIVFKKIEFLNPKNPGEPSWKLSEGTTTCSIDVTVVTMQFGPDGTLQLPKTTDACSGTMSFDVEVLITQ